MKKRVNITIGPLLHEKALAYAEAEEMDFSELVAHALRRVIRAEEAGELPAKSPPVARKPAPLPAPSSLPELRPLREGEHPSKGGPCPCGSGQKYKRCCLPFAPLVRLAPLPGPVLADQ